MPTPNSFGEFFSSLKQTTTGRQKQNVTNERIDDINAGKYKILDRFIQASGVTKHLKIGDVVPVLWKNGQPQLIIAHQWNKSGTPVVFAAVENVFEYLYTGVSYEIYQQYASDPFTNSDLLLKNYDIYFMDQNQFTSLGLKAALTAGGYTAIVTKNTFNPSILTYQNVISGVFWGERNDTFCVELSDYNPTSGILTKKYAVFKLTRKENEVYPKGKRAAITKITTQRLFLIQGPLDHADFAIPNSYAWSYSNNQKFVEIRANQSLTAKYQSLHEHPSGLYPTIAFDAPVIVDKPQTWTGGGSGISSTRPIATFATLNKNLEVIVYVSDAFGSVSPSTGNVSYWTVADDHFSFEVTLPIREGGYNWFVFTATYTDPIEVNLPDFAGYLESGHSVPIVLTSDYPRIPGTSVFATSSSLEQIQDYGDVPFDIRGVVTSYSPINYITVIDEAHPVFGYQQLVAPFPTTITYTITCKTNGNPNIKGIKLYYNQSEISTINAGPPSVVAAALPGTLVEERLIGEESPEVAYVNVRAENTFANRQTNGNGTPLYGLANMSTGRLLFNLGGQQTVTQSGTNYIGSNTRNPNGTNDFPIYWILPFPVYLRNADDPDTIIIYPAQVWGDGDGPFIVKTPSFSSINEYFWSVGASPSYQNIPVTDQSIFRSLVKHTINMDYPNMEAVTVSASFPYPGAIAWSLQEENFIGTWINLNDHTLNGSTSTGPGNFYFSGNISGMPHGWFIDSFSNVVTPPDGRDIYGNFVPGISADARSISEPLATFGIYPTPSGGQLSLDAALALNADTSIIWFEGTSLDWALEHFYEQVGGFSTSKQVAHTDANAQLLVVDYGSSPSEAIILAWITISKDLNAGSATNRNWGYWGSPYGNAGYDNYSPATYTSLVILDGHGDVKRILLANERVEEVEIYAATRHHMLWGKIGDYYNLSDPSSPAIFYLTDIDTGKTLEIGRDRGLIFGQYLLVPASSDYTNRFSKMITFQIDNGPTESNIRIHPDFLIYQSLFIKAWEYVSGDLLNNKGQKFLDLAVPNFPQTVDAPMNKLLALFTKLILKLNKTGKPPHPIIQTIGFSKHIVNYKKVLSKIGRYKAN